MYYGQGKNKKLDELYEILSDCWDIDTCAPRMRNNYSSDNKTLGQCSITAFLIQDLLGGLVYGVKLDDGNYHCFNYINNQIYDLTSEQFDHELEYTLEHKQSREIHFNKQEKYQRYLLLKDRYTKHNK